MNSFIGHSDTLFLKKSIFRLPGESFQDTLQRYEWIKRNTPEYSLGSIVGHMANELGITPKPVLKISNTEFVYIKDLKLHIDDTEYSLVNRTVGDIQVLLSGSEVLTEYISTKPAYYIMPFTNISDYKLVTLTSNLTHLPDSNIQDYLFSNNDVYRNKVDSLDLVVESGDYYLNSDSGYLYSYDTPKGQILYRHIKSPFVIYTTDLIVSELSQNNLRIYDGEITSFGVSLYNQLLKVHSVEWGK